MPSAISPIPIAPGDTFSRWTVLARAKAPDGHAQWLCRCVCGVERGVQARKLREGKSTGCGRSCPAEKPGGNGGGGGGAAVSDALHHRTVTLRPDSIGCAC